MEKLRNGWCLAPLGLHPVIQPLTPSSPGPMYVSLLKQINLVIWQIDGETMETVTDFISLGSKITADDDCSHEIKRCLLIGWLCQERPSSQGYGFSCSHVWMWELNCEEDWVPKNWCFWSVVLEKTLESPLDCKEIQPVHSKGQRDQNRLGMCSPALGREVTETTSGERQSQERNFRGSQTFVVAYCLDEQQFYSPNVY